MTAEHDVIALRREFVLTCASSGQILEADEPAAGLADLTAGVSLTERAADGSREKLQQFLARCAEGPELGWEATLVVRNEPVTVELRGVPRSEGRALIVGSLIPQEFEQSMLQVRQAMSELAVLHRTTARQQQELLRRNEELAELNRELEDSARGMIALHDEVDEKSDSLRRISEVKARMVSNVSHEFRTPLNSILGLTRMLLSRADGDLTEEQEKQLNYIRRSAESMSELVDDVLDLSKLEAGKTTLRASQFQVKELFSALRGMFKPLVQNPKVEIVFEDPPADFPFLETDENKVSQILKNFLSNAIKFTEEGEIRVTVSTLDDDQVVFAVKDTGIGIDAQYFDKIFEEFSQLENPLQSRVKGTGLGLSLSRRVAAIMGGDVRVESEVGKGSTFYFELPRVHPEVREMHRLEHEAENLDPSRSPVLVVEDDRQTLFLYERYLRGSGFQVIPARTLTEARDALQRLRPSAIVLDIMLDGESSWSFLAEVKHAEETRDIPVLVVTVTNREQRARALGADEFCVKPMDREWFMRRLQNVAKYRGTVERILVIDDDEVSRYLIRKMLANTSYRVLDAVDARDGIEKARRERPHLILLDFVLPNATAFDVLDELKVDPQTRNIPVLIQTSKQLTQDEKTLLARDTASVIPKQSLSREVAIARIREALIQSGIGQVSAGRA
jgi:signal transduction histidine kinase/CheY-like chemotaxis protein